MVPLTPTGPKDEVMIVTFVRILMVFHCTKTSEVFHRSGEERITAVQGERQILNAVVKLPVLLEEVPSGQSTRGEETKRYRGPEPGLNTPARCCTKEGDTASQGKLRAVVLVLLEKVSCQKSLILVRLDIE